jgi:type II secretory pathway pseudopilin PulG
VLTWPRHRIAEPARDAGTTLIELVVAMVLATIFGAFAMTWFLGASDASTATTSADLGTAGARNALQTWAALLRVAGSPSDPGSGTDRIIDLSATSITFNAYAAGPDSCSAACSEFSTKTVTLAMTGSDCGLTTPANCQLVETGAGSDPSAYDVIVPGGVSADGCLFTAYDSDGADLGCTALSADSLASVTSIGLAFAVTTDARTHSFQTSAALTQRPGSNT